MKVIATRVVAANAQPIPKTIIDTEYPVLESDFLSTELTDDGFKALIQESRLANEILAILEEEYHLRIINRDDAVRVILNWVNDIRDRISDTTLGLLIDGIDVHDIGVQLLNEHTNPVDTRAGRLNRNNIIPLIGESNHVKNNSNR